MHEPYPRLLPSLPPRRQITSSTTDRADCLPRYPRLPYPPTEPEVSEGGAVITPIQHRTNPLECDDDEWEEIRNFMKCLTRMYHDQGRDVVFYENAVPPYRKLHAAIMAVPIPFKLGETAPAFFREAILASDE